LVAKLPTIGGLASHCHERLTIAKGCRGVKKVEKNGDEGKEWLLMVDFPSSFMNHNLCSLSEVELSFPPLIPHLKSSSVLFFS